MVNKSLGGLVGDRQSTEMEWHYGIVKGVPVPCGVEGLYPIPKKIRGVITSLDIMQSCAFAYYFNRLNLGAKPKMGTWGSATLNPLFPLHFNDWFKIENVAEII